MTKEQIVTKLKEWFNHSDGGDYYDYTTCDHWWGEEPELEGFAEELLVELDKDKSPT